MAKKKVSAVALFDTALRTAPCVTRIQAAVEAWRADHYPNITATTRLLFNHWFAREHRPQGRKFAYHPFQQEAIETLVFLYESAEARRQKTLVEKYAVRSDLRLLRYDDFARYCVKMATGTGKTKVMALALLWQYFNAVAEAREDYARTFLMLAPNIIVFERLREDFQYGKIFKADPMIPPELEVFWDFQVYVRGEPERAGSLGALYLTNIQQFQDRDRPAKTNEPEEMTGVMGPKPPASLQEIADFDQRIIAQKYPIAVLNDEAHHTHDEDSEWNRFIRRLHQESGQKIVAQLDFTATPRHTKGDLFTWTVYDYPLKQAILDGIVKRPIKGITKDVAGPHSVVTSVKYQPWLVAGVERWREYRDQLKPSGRMPVLFVMMNSTKEADEVAGWLRRRYPEEFAGAALRVIHTDNTGEVSKKDLEAAREAVRRVDEADSPIRCIVSVLMLREGWDVKNVTVIVGCRPYTAKANILPEQTIGRGLRLMFRDIHSDYQERVDILGTKAFIEFVAELEREEGMEFDTFEVGKDHVRIVTIFPDRGKIAMDLALPVLTPVLLRKKSLADEIAGLDVMAFECPTLPLSETDKGAEAFRYEGYDIITLKRVVAREYAIPEPQTVAEVIGFYAERIARDVRLPGQFAALVPKIREFLERKAFGKAVDLSAPGVLRAVSANTTHYVTRRTFAQALRAVAVEEAEPTLGGDPRRLSETPPFPWSRQTEPGSKTVFNLVPCVNDFEAAFARFLEHAEDVQAFAKLPEPFGFAIEYVDGLSNLRYYEPDFVVLGQDDAHYLMETKGREDPLVPYKDRAAELWCENATRLTGLPWRYVKVPESLFLSLQAETLAELVTAAE